MFYRRPTLVVDLASFAVRGAGSAIEAAKLQCMDGLSFSSLSAVLDATVVGRDASGQSRQTHVVVAAEREDVCETIADMVEESGLRLFSVTALDALLISSVVEMALANKSDQALLYIGECRSFFATFSGGSLHLSRQIDIGIDQMVTSLTRPLRAADRPDAIELDLETARTILHQYGIPPRDQIVETSHSLTGAHLIPLLQPVVQRFHVELRQSLRFGIDESDRDEASIRLLGPGSAIPNLAPLIADELGVTATADPAYERYNWKEPGSDGGELKDAVKAHGFAKRLSLLPAALAQQRYSGQMRRWLWVGMAAALIVIALDGLLYHAQLRDARRQAENYDAQITVRKTLLSTSERIGAVLDAMGSVKETMQEHIGSRVVYSSCLKELSRIVPETIRCTAISFHQSDRGIEGTIRGFAFANGSSATRTDLEPFIQKLRASPLFEDVSLGDVRVLTVGRDVAEQFVATVVPVELPRDLPQSSLGSVAVGGRNP